VKHWSLEERQRLRDDVPKLGLKATTPGGETLRDLGSESSQSPNPASTLVGA
jgi:glutamate--cysteine ligase